MGDNTDDTAIATTVDDDDATIDAKPPVQEPSNTRDSSSETKKVQPQDQPQPPHLESSPNPATPTQTSLPSEAPSTSESKGTTPASAAPSTTATATIPSQVAPASAPPVPSSNEAADVIYIPSYSRWFSWNNIHECEARFMPEFFEGKSPSKSPRVYKYYRNTIIKRFRENPTRRITFTDARRVIIGDVASVRKVFDFLETWGLINYNPSGSKPPLKWDDKESKSTASAATAAQNGEQGLVANDVCTPKKRICGSCKSVCTIACFASNKNDLTLCARCYVRGSYRTGLASSDFKRVEINEEIKADWTDKETLHLLEAIMHFGEDWKKVAEYVGGRSEKECVAHFIKLPFGEQFVGPPASAEVDDNSGSGSPASKRMRLSPLADASNPIMAQAAFLSALVGAEVAETAAQSAVSALSDISDGGIKPVSGAARMQEPNSASNGSTSSDAAKEAHIEAQLQLEKDARDLEGAISEVAEVKMKEINDKIAHFEELDLQMEKEWQHLEHMKNLLFVDQLTLLFHQTSGAKTGEKVGATIKAADISNPVLLGSLSSI